MTPHEIATVKHVRLNRDVCGFPAGKVLKVIGPFSRDEGVEREALHLAPDWFDAVSIPVVKGTRK